jgi:hypothetical protein
MTEGLMYEYARGKRVLKSFKNSVAISALIMFVGIGTLIFAKHPAMSSLGVIVVIGMFSVVAASFIFPPLLFDFLTKKRDGTKRAAPYTLRSLILSGVKNAADVSNLDCCKKIVLRNYLYKGMDVWRAVSKSLDNFVYLPENYRNLDKITFENCGYGATAFLVALKLPDIQVVATDTEEFIEVARNCSELPKNLRFEVKPDNQP